jgi:hypothetical protein
MPVKSSESQESEQQQGAKSEKVRKFLALAHARFKSSADAESRVRQEALDDMEFSIGNQWPDDIYQQRTTEGKPCITMNRLPQTIRYVTNEQRQQRPAAQINPVGSGASVDRAQIREGIIRHIEVNSEADIADDTAFDSMVRCGFGYQRIVTDYAAEVGDEQELFIRWVRNSFTVYDDPTAQLPDKSDRKFCFFIQDMPAEEFKQEYPNAAMAGLRDFTSLGDASMEWANSEKQTIRIAEYFFLEKSKDSRRPKVKWAMISALDILDGNDEATDGRYWPGEDASRYIPLVKVVGDDLDVNGKQHQAGLVRHLKSPMKQYNAMTSAMTQSAMLAPVAPWIAETRQIEGYEEDWRLSNRRATAVLRYHAVSERDTPVPAPQRVSSEPPIQAFGVLLARAEMDLQACAGVYNPALGKESSSDQSGKAINSLQQRSDVNTLNFSDNQARSIRFRTRILLDCIPKVYDTHRVMRIINPDGTVRHVVTHNGADQAEFAKELAQQQEIKEIFDLGIGTYDCTVSVGPSYQTKRQQAADTQLQLLKLLPPQVAQILMDLVIRNMDIPQANEMADRIKKQLPPELLDEGQSDPKQQIIQLQAQLKQIALQNQQLQAVNSDMLGVITKKTIEQKGKLDLEHLKILGQVLVAEINTKSQDQQQRLEMFNDMLAQLGEHGHEAASAAQVHAQEMQKQQQAAANQSALTSQQAGHQSAQSSQDASQALVAQQAAAPQPGAGA